VIFAIVEVEKMRELDVEVTELIRVIFSPFDMNNLALLWSGDECEKCGKNQLRVDERS
jgi:hypothetical protein